MNIERVNKFTDDEIQAIQKLFLEYQEELGLDLCFQGFKEELANLSQIYGPPYGALLIAKEGSQVVGVVALKRLDEGICEMKRLYVKPEFRSKKVGLKLAQNIIDIGKEMQYFTMKLDTLQRLKPAISLYQFLGFTATKAYNYNPDETVQYFELNLEKWQS